MKRFMLFTLFTLTTLSLTLAGPGQIVITPDPVVSGAQAPSVCVSKFKANSFISVWLPAPIPSYNFMITERGTYCYQADDTVTLAPGTYDVPSMVCHYVAGSIPTGCKAGPTVTLTVE